METALYEGKRLYACDVAASYETEKEIRVASSEKRLFCPDAHCGAPLIYKHGDIRDAYFSHPHGAAGCRYDEYDRGSSEAVKSVRRKLCEHFRKLGCNVEMDVMLVSGRYTPLCVTGSDGRRYAIEVNSTAKSVKNIILSQLDYDRAGIPMRRVIVDDPTRALTEDGTYFIKRFELNESPDGIAVVVDTTVRGAAIYKLDRNEYKYKGFDYPAVSRENVFAYSCPVSGIYFLDGSFTAEGFEDAFSKWQSEKKAALDAYIAMREDVLRLKTEAHTAYAAAQDASEPVYHAKPPKPKKEKPAAEFIPEQVTVKRTLRPVGNEKYFSQWIKEDFSQSLKKVTLQSDEAELRRLIGKVYECSDEELELFLSLMRATESAPRNPQTELCMRIIRHILRQTRRG